MENETIRKKIERMYPGVYEIPQEEVETYIEYCDEAPYKAKNPRDFKTFQELKDKCRRNGIESIVFRKDVTNIGKYHFNEGWNDGHDVDYDYILVTTNYGVFRYTKDRKII